MYFKDILVPRDIGKHNENLKEKQINHMKTLKSRRINSWSFLITTMHLYLSECCENYFQNSMHRTI